MIEITEEYKRVFKAIDNNEPFVFVTGSGGTGKSTLIHEIAKLENVLVTSSTGLSAFNIGGVTLHSLFGLPPTIVDETQLKLDKNYAILEVAEVLVIDEVSMIRCDILDAINCGLQTVKGNDKPFGGVTVIGVGDLFQLPPVTNPKDLSTLKRMGYPNAWFFNAHCLGEIEYRVVQLSKIFRQKDGEFKDILEDLRFGRNKDGIIKFLNTKVSGRSNAITLCTRNVDVDTINKRELGKLSTEAQVFSYTYSGKIPADKDLPAPKTLSLKEGAMVMVTKNDPNGKFVNGTTGKITKLTASSVFIQTDKESLEISASTWQNTGYNLKDGVIDTKVLGSYTQLPVILAFALTIHKAQGRTIDNLTIDLGKGSFATGQTYVAISRLTSFDGLTLKTPIRRKDILVDRNCLKFMGVK